jgi:hypothetical protein
LFEHCVFVEYGNEFIVAESFGVRIVRQIKVPCLTEFPNNEGFIQLKKVSAGLISLYTQPYVIFFEEGLRIAIAVYIIFYHGIEDIRILADHFGRKAQAKGESTSACSSVALHKQAHQ